MSVSSSVFQHHSKPYRIYACIDIITDVGYYITESVDTVYQFIVRIVRAVVGRIFVWRFNIILYWVCKVLSPSPLV